ncbi:MAG: hypothetical protein IJ833_02755 [Lachnospiraceae bacterium]|nr:hypothetical protein [Lachnospiraceae bacterium]
MNSNIRKQFLKRELLPMLVCALLGFIAITISSKNSFLYDFNDSGDVQVFVTTARCMLRGDVLYRDVFDVKGPLLYFFYIGGLLIDNSSFLGIFLLESILFVIFTVFCFLIAGLYFENSVLRIVIAAISAFVATTCYDFFGGGQCEELVLPVLAAAIYIVLRYFRQEYPKRIKWFETVLIGICTGIVFWIKYTMVGLFLGIILYIIYLQIKNKRIKDIWIYAGEFLAGFLFASFPAIVYFLVHHAFEYLWEVYFYDLIFAYKTVEDTSSHLLTNQFYLFYIAVSALTAFALIYPALDGERHLGKQEGQMISLMVGMQAVGISAGRNWYYVAECMNAFAPIGMVGLTFTAMDCKDRAGKLLKKTSNAVRTLLREDFLKGHFYLTVVAGILLLLDVRLFILPIVVVIGAVLFTRLLQYLLKNLSQRSLRMLAAKYIGMLVLAYVCTLSLETSRTAILAAKNSPIALSYFFGLTIFLMFMDDYSFWGEEIASSVCKLLKQWQAEYLKARGGFNLLVGVLAVFMYTFYCYALSKSSQDIGRPLENRAQYELCEYVKNSGVDNPIVIIYQDIDFGYYWLTQSYPATKFSCGFNMNIPELQEMYEEYIDGKKADFIITGSSEDASFYGYQKVYSARDVYVDITHYRDFVLWQKMDD